MKIYTKVVMDLETFEVLEEESFEYDGPLALALAAGGGLPDDGDDDDDEDDGGGEDPVTEIPIGWAEESGGGISSSYGYDFERSGTDWDNPWVNQALLDTTGATTFSVPEGTTPYSTSQSSSFQGMDWDNPYVQEIYEAISPGIEDFSVDPSLRDYSEEQATASNVSSGQSGMDWEDPFSSQILSTLTEEALALPGYASEMGDTLTTGYSNMLQEAMGPEGFQSTLEDLSSRGMIDSTVASNALAGTASDIATSVADKSFEAQMAQLETQMGVPTTLAEMAALGQTSSEQAQGKSQSSSYQEDELAGTALQGEYNTQMLSALADIGIISESQASAYEEDPLAQYELMAQYYPDILDAISTMGKEDVGRSEDWSDSDYWSSKYWEDPSATATV